MWIVTASLCQCTSNIFLMTTVFYTIYYVLKGYCLIHVICILSVPCTNSLLIALSSNSVLVSSHFFPCTFNLYVRVPKLLCTATLPTVSNFLNDIYLLLWRITVQLCISRCSIQMLPVVGICCCASSSYL